MAYSDALGGDRGWKYTGWNYYVSQISELLVWGDWNNPHILCTRFL